MRAANPETLWAITRGVKRWVIVGAAAASLFASAGARGSPLELYGFGARSSGMAGLGVSLSNDFDSVYLNPAGLADVAGRRLTIGGVYGKFGLELDGADTGTDAARGVTWGGAFRLPLGGALAGRVGIGIGLFVPSDALVRADVPLPGVPVFALLESRSHVIGLMAAVGARVTERLSVGAGVLVLAELRGGINVDVDGAQRFRAESEQRTITDLAPIVGARCAVSSDLVLGLTFRGASSSDYEIVVTNNLGDSFPLGLPELTIAGTAQYDPTMVAAEVAWRAARRVTLAGQLSYQRWSAFPPPTKNPLANGEELEPPDFHDTAVPRVGAEIALPAPIGDRAVARLGYAFMWSPAPEMDRRLSLLDNHRHVIAAGLGLAWKGNWPINIDVWGQLHALMPRTHTKDPDAFEPDEMLPFDTIRASGHIVVGGLSLGVSL